MLTQYTATEPLVEMLKPMRARTAEEGSCERSHRRRLGPVEHRTHWADDRPAE